MICRRQNLPSQPGNNCDGRKELVQVLSALHRCTRLTGKTRAVTWRRYGGYINHLSKTKKKIYIHYIRECLARVRPCIFFFSFRARAWDERKQRDSCTRNNNITLTLRYEWRMYFFRFRGAKKKGRKKIKFTTIRNGFRRGLTHTWLASKNDCATAAAGAAPWRYCTRIITAAAAARRKGVRRRLTTVTVITLLPCRRSSRAGIRRSAGGDHGERWVAADFNFYFNILCLYGAPTYLRAITGNLCMCNGKCAQCVLRLCARANCYYTFLLLLFRNGKWSRKFNVAIPSSVLFAFAGRFDGENANGIVLRATYRFTPKRGTIFDNRPYRVNRHAICSRTKCHGRGRAKTTPPQACWPGAWDWVNPSVDESKRMPLKRA